MRFFNKAITISFFSIACVPSAFASNTNPQGSVIVRIDDGTGNGRCIGASDRLTATLRRVILEKNSRWLGLVEDKDVGITLTTTVNGTSTDDAKTASFAKVVKEQVGSYSDGQISLAQEQSLLNKFSLTNGQNSFSLVDLEVGIVKTSGKSVGAQILLSAVGATKDLSLPPNPFASQYSVATAYVSNIFEPLIDQAASQQEAVSHHIVMNIDAANCAGDDERTGTKAIIDSVADSSQPGYVDTNMVNSSYCFKAELKPAFVIKVAPMPNTRSCNDATSFTELRNSYLAFYVNSLPAEVPSLTQKTLDATPHVMSLDAMGRGVASDVSRTPADPVATFAAEVMSKPVTQVAKKYHLKTTSVDAYRDAIRRCQSNGTPLKNCL